MFIFNARDLNNETSYLHGHEDDIVHAYVFEGNVQYFLECS